jgi:Rab proteins geranylgeranyltransferase component A
VTALIAALPNADEQKACEILYTLRYAQSSRSKAEVSIDLEQHMAEFPAVSLDMAFDENMLDQVKQVWKSIVGDEGGEFCVFTDREGEAYDDDDEEDTL